MLHKSHSPLDLVTGVGNTLLDLVHGGLAVVWSHLVGELCEAGQQCER